MNLFDKMQNTLPPPSVTRPSSITQTDKYIIIAIIKQQSVTLQTQEKDNLKPALLTRWVVIDNLMTVIVFIHAKHVFRNGNVDR